MDIVSFKAEVDDQLVHAVIDLVFAVQIVIHDSIGLSLRVGHDQSSGNCEVKLSRRESVGVGEFLNVVKGTWF
jgi:hypothetical protein